MNSLAFYENILLKDSFNIKENDFNYNDSLLVDDTITFSSTSLLSFSTQIDMLTTGKWDKNTNLIVLLHTPSLYLKMGINDRPITVTANKLDRIINTYGKQKDNYHGLGIELVKQLPQAIEKPILIVQSSTRNDSIVIVTKLLDKQKRVVIISLLLDGKGNIKIRDIGNIEKNKNTNTNVMTSAYGRNNYNLWMNKKKKNNLIIYDLKKGILKKRIDSEWVEYID